MPQKKGNKKIKGRGSPKGRGGRSPKKSLGQEPFQEDPAAAAAFDAVVNRQYDANATHQAHQSHRNPSWEHDDVDDCDPMAEDDYTPADDWEAAASTPRPLLALAAAPAPSMASPASDANTEEFMAYLDRDDDENLPEADSDLKTLASKPAANPEVELLKAKLETAQLELSELSKNVETANQRALEQKTALFHERQTTKELRKQLDEAIARVPASEQVAAALRVQHSADLEQLRVEHDLAMEAAVREQRSQAAALREKLTQVQADLAGERDAHAATRAQLAKIATERGDASKRPRLKHRMAAEMHAQQQSNFPNNPPTPTGTPVGTPRDGVERVPSRPSLGLPESAAESSLLDEWRRKEQLQLEPSPGTSGKTRRAITTKRTGDGRALIGTSLQEDAHETGRAPGSAYGREQPIRQQSRPEMRTLPEISPGRGAASKIEMWKARERGGTSPLPCAEEGTVEEAPELAEQNANGTPTDDEATIEAGASRRGRPTEAMRAAFMKLNQELELEEEVVASTPESNVDLEDDGDAPADGRGVVMALCDSQSDDVNGRGRRQQGGDNRDGPASKSPPRVRTPPRPARTDDSSRRLSATSATWSLSASTMSHVSNGSFGPSRGEIHTRTAQGVKREKLERQKILREAAYLRRQLQRRWLHCVLAAWVANHQQTIAHKRLQQLETQGTQRKGRAGVNRGLCEAASVRQSPTRRRSRARTSTRRAGRSSPPLREGVQDGQHEEQRQDPDRSEAGELVASATSVLRAPRLDETGRQISEVHKEYDRICSHGGFEDIALPADTSASPVGSTLSVDMLSFSAWLHATHAGFRRSTGAAARGCDHFAFTRWVVGLPSRLNKLQRYYDEMVSSTSPCWSHVTSSREDAAAHFLFDVVASGSEGCDDRWTHQQGRAQGRKLQTITREQLGWVMGILGSCDAETAAAELLLRSDVGLVARVPVASVTALLHNEIVCHIAMTAWLSATATARSKCC